MSLSNTIAVDHSTDASEVKEYRRFDESQPNRTTYIGPEHTDHLRQQFTVYRSPISVTKTSRGMKKTAIKFTLDRVVPNASGDGDITLPQICELSVSVPVGCTDLDTAELRNAMVSFLSGAEIVRLQDIREI